MRRVPGVQHTQRLGDVIRLFAHHPSVGAIAVLSGEAPIGVICRDLIADVADLPCYRAWIDRECCMQFVSHPPYTLCIDADVADLARALTPDPHRHPAEPLVVTGDGVYLGIIERQALLGALMAMRQVPCGPAKPARTLAPDCLSEIALSD